jgi:hypothetical protein
MSLTYLLMPLVLGLLAFGTYSTWKSSIHIPGGAEWEDLLRNKFLWKERALYSIYGALFLYIIQQALK